MARPPHALEVRELRPCHLSTVPALTHGSPAELPSASAKVGGGKRSSLTHSPVTPPGPTDHSPPRPLPLGRLELGCPLLGLPPAALSGARLAGRQRLAARVGGHLRRGRGAGRGDSQSPRASEGRWCGGARVPTHTVIIEAPSSCLQRSRAGCWRPVEAAGCLPSRDPGWGCVGFTARLGLTSLTTHPTCCCGPTLSE